MSKAKIWFKDKLTYKLTYIKEIIAGADHSSTKMAEDTAPRDLKDSKVYYTSCFKGFMGMSSGWLDHVDVMLIKKPDGNALLYVSSYWFDGTHTRISGEVGLEILLRTLLYNASSITILQLFDTQGKMVTLFKALSPTIVTELVDQHNHVACGVIPAARFLCEKSIENMTIFKSTYMLNLYQHPAICSFVAGKKSVGNEGEEQQLDVDKFISDSFFGLTITFKQCDLLLPELWAKIAGYLQLKDIDMEITGWNYKMTDSWYDDGGYDPCDSSSL
jgi:hypothetical protein